MKILFKYTFFELVFCWVFEILFLCFYLWSKILFWAWNLFFNWIITDFEYFSCLYFEGRIGSNFCFLRVQWLLLSISDFFKFFFIFIFNLNFDKHSLMDFDNSICCYKLNFKIVQVLKKCWNSQIFIKKYLLYYLWNIYLIRFLMFTAYCSSYSIFYFMKFFTE